MLMYDYENNVNVNFNNNVVYRSFREKFHNLILDRISSKQ